MSTTDYSYKLLHVQRKALGLDTTVSFAWPAWVKWVRRAGGDARAVQRLAVAEVVRIHGDGLPGTASARVAKMLDQVLPRA